MCGRGATTQQGGASHPHTHLLFNRSWPSKSSLFIRHEETAYINIFKMEQGYLIAVTIAMQILILVAIQVQQIVQHQTSKWLMSMVHEQVMKQDQKISELFTLWKFSKLTSIYYAHKCRNKAKYIFTIFQYHIPRIKKCQA